MTDETKPTFARPIGWYRLTTKQRLLWAEHFLKQILKNDDERREVTSRSGWLFVRTPPGAPEKLEC